MTRPRTVATHNVEVPAKLVVHDLITVPAGLVPGIFWLRLYAAAPDWVAIVTEVPGNPGWTVTNCISRIACYLQAQYEITPEALVLYEVWPNRAGDAGGPSIKRIRFGPSPEWTTASRIEIENMVETSLPALPAHEELYRRVLALGGGVSEERTRRVFEAVPVSELPPPHHPSNCKHLARFHQLGAQKPLRWAPSFDANLETGKAFLATLTPPDLRACRYHVADWKAIAEESVRIISELGRCEDEEYITAASQSLIEDDDRGWLLSLFRDPIFIGGGSYTNGQHRGCALRFSGAERAAVVTDREILGEECTDWTYLGDG